MIILSPSVAEGLSSHGIFLSAVSAFLPIPLLQARSAVKWSIISHGNTVKCAQTDLFQAERLDRTLLSAIVISKIQKPKLG